MTENKRFTMCHEQNDINGWTMSIVDWQTKEPFNYTTYEVHSISMTDTKDEMEDLCLLLNELAEEKKELQSQCNLLQEQANEFHRGARENANRVGQLKIENKKLKEENENLKQALWEAEEGYLYEVYHDPIRLQDKIMNLKEDWDKEYWND